MTDNYFLMICSADFNDIMNVMDNCFLMICGVSGVEVGNKNRSKFDAKVEPKTGCISPSILADCWSTYGTKLGCEIDQKSIPKRSENGVENAAHLGLDF